MKLLALSLLLGSTLVLGACAPPSGDMGSWELKDDTPSTGLEEGVNDMEKEMEPLKGAADQEQL